MEQQDAYGKINISKHAFLGHCFMDTIFLGQTFNVSSERGIHKVLSITCQDDVTKTEALQQAALESMAVFGTKED